MSSSSSSSSDSETQKTTQRSSSSRRNNLTLDAGMVDLRGADPAPSLFTPSSRTRPQQDFESPFIHEHAGSTPANGSHSNHKTLGGGGGGIAPLVRQGSLKRRPPPALSQDTLAEEGGVDPQPGLANPSTRPPPLMNPFEDDNNTTTTTRQPRIGFIRQGSLRKTGKSLVLAHDALASEGGVDPQPGLASPRATNGTSSSGHHRVVDVNPFAASPSPPPRKKKPTIVFVDEDVNGGGADPFPNFRPGTKMVRFVSPFEEDDDMPSSTTATAAAPGTPHPARNVSTMMNKAQLSRPPPPISNTGGFDHIPTRTPYPSRQVSGTSLSIDAPNTTALLADAAAKLATARTPAPTRQVSSNELDLTDESNVTSVLSRAAIRLSNASTPAPTRQSSTTELGDDVPPPSTATVLTNAATRLAIRTTSLDLSKPLSSSSSSTARFAVPAMPDDVERRELLRRARTAERKLALVLMCKAVQRLHLVALRRSFVTWRRRANTSTSLDLAQQLLGRLQIVNSDEKTLS